MMQEQTSFIEALLDPGLGRNARLERIEGLLDWAPLGKIAGRIRTGEIGRRPYPPLSMFKALLLAQWYGLSDPGLEEALSDRVSFRRFCGFAMDEATPDETTFCRFRGALAAASLGDALFTEVSRQLEAKGLILKTGSLIDATLIEAAVRPPAKPAEGAPAEAPLDGDAGFTRSGPHRRLFYGYKAHVGVDEGSGLIRRRLLTPATTYESEVADALISWDEGAVYADKAYEKAARRKALKDAGIKDRILHRRNKHHPLPFWAGVRNRLITPIRSAVERVFAVFKRGYGLKRARYRGLAANALHLDFVVLAYNLRRADVLTR
jgi:IS5 family transposase